jgi:hypothetical protein
MAETLPFTLLPPEEGKVVLLATPEPRFCNLTNTVHGGWIMTMLDTVMALAAQPLEPAVTLTARSPKRLCHLVLESHDGSALGADSEEKHEPVSDIDTVVLDSLKALDPEWPIREEKHEPVSDIDTVVVDSLKALDPEWPIREAGSLCEIMYLGSPIRWKCIQQGPKLQPRWMPPIENRLDEAWSEQGKSQDAADIGLVDLLGCGKIRNGSMCPVFKHAPPAVGASNRLNHRAVDARPWGRPRARAVRGKYDLAAAPSAYPQRNVDR